MKKVPPIAYLAVMPLLSTACIHDDNADCLYGYKVDVFIQDKNYDNINLFPALSREDENQPFSHFSSTLYYVLTNERTGQAIRESEVVSTASSGMSYPISFDNLPIGEYHLAVWGNLTNDILPGILHPNGKEHTDVYAASTRFSITNKDIATQLQLKRTKGKLLIFCDNFPNHIVRIGQSLTNIYAQTDAALHYSQPIILEKDTALQQTNTLCAAPTPPGQTSQLSLSFYAANSNKPLLTVSDLPINVLRNQLSAITVDYDDVNKLWNIWTYINGEWMLLHRLTII